MYYFIACINKVPFQVGPFDTRDDVERVRNFISEQKMTGDWISEIWRCTGSELDHV